MLWNGRTICHIIIISVIAVSSVRIVDAGNRGIIVQFRNVATDSSFDEEIYQCGLI
jgi:prohibitin 2